MCRTRHQGRRTRALAGVLFMLLFGLAPSACAPSGPGDTEESTTGPTEGPQAVTLAWSEPSHDANGDPLEDLAGYRIYYGRQSPVTPDNASTVEVGLETRHTVEELEPDVWFFAVTAVDESGNESDLSDELRADLR